MRTRNHFADFRILVVGGFFFGACSYELPSEGPASTSSSSSSSGMGGAGGKEPAGSVSSSSGKGGAGGLPSGAGGLGGVGGLGGAGTASVSSSSGIGGGGGMGGGGVSVSVVDCGLKPCDTTGPAICCMPPAVPGLSYCSEDGSCVADNHQIDCDDKADCPDLFCCFDMSANSSACNKDNCQKIICKTDGDCPAMKSCGPQMGRFRFCGP